MTRPWNFFLRNEPWRGHRELFITIPGRPGRVVLPKIKFIEAERGLPHEPALECTLEQLQDEMDPIHGLLQGALDFAWANGMRPTGWKADPDASAELAATRYHLEDMRALAKIPTRQKDQP